MARMSRRTFLEQTGKGAAAIGLAALVAKAKLHAAPLGLPIGCQTYPSREQIAQGRFAEVLKNLKAAGIAQIELCSPGYAQFKSLADGKATRQMITDAGLTCPSAHFSMNEFRTRLNESMEWAHAVGMTQIGVAGLGGGMVNGVTSLSQVQYAAGEYNRIGMLVKRNGLQLFLHNEGFENSRLDDGRLTYPVLLGELDPELVKMQFQMSSMRTIGDPVMYFTNYPGRFISAHVHGVDLSQGPVPVRGMPLPMKPEPGAAAGGRGRGPGVPGIAIGDDSVDWPRVFTAAKMGGLKNYFIEQEQANGWEVTLKGVAYLKTLS